MLDQSGLRRPGPRPPVNGRSSPARNPSGGGGDTQRRIAISGHRGLPASTVTLVEKAIRGILARHAPEIRGVSCLADGADQIFARAVVDLGGTLEAVVCSQRYREGLPPNSRDEYDTLMTAAEKVHRLRYVESTDESLMEGSKLMLDLAEELYAVWDGKPARGYGGTADVVAEARRRGIEVHVIWPDGARRE
ncbi:hypothetical protein ACWEN6_26800 [Sphaerisporangium sp. NPDC004334]